MRVYFFGLKCLLTCPLHTIDLCFHLSSQLDLSFEMMLADPSKRISREEFREKVFAAEPESINTDACDFLFDVLDYNHDEVIDKNDFRIM